ncbi:redoxin domain-containing protein [Fictibacillus iocasae]|uniref:Redoxin domain-containing protein n=1 Tax=Fictibacillus iocasae TaxID=2715437 RepID=A0ABW2NKS9_9BACL
MNSYIMIGNFPLKSDVLFLLVSGLAAYVLLYVLLRNDGHRKDMLNILSNSVITGLAVWKFSYVLFHPSAALNNPLNILYFSGSTPGILIGAIAGIAILLVSIRKQKLPFTALFFSATYAFTIFYALYFALRYMLAEQNTAEGILSLLMFAASVYLTFVKSRDIRNASLALVGISLVFTMANASPSVKKAEQPKAIETKAATIGIKPGNKAPNFELETLDSKTMNLSDQKGKVVFVNIWATWCPPCRAEMPEMQAFYKKYGGNEAEILAVNLTDSDSREAARKFAKENKLTFPVLLDTEGTVGSAYRAVTIPTTYIINKDGIITNRHIGPMDANTMENYLQQAQ